MLAENNKALVFMGDAVRALRAAQRKRANIAFSPPSADFFRSRFNKVMMRAFYDCFCRQT
jgi:hypothetical protein